jgi:hypothetical protein
MDLKWNDTTHKRGKKKPLGAAFVEYSYGCSIKPVFTIAEEDHDGYLSFPKLFLAHYKDPTEMSFVNDVFNGDLKYWNQFKSANNVEKLYKELREKADLMLQSEAMNKIVSIAFDDNNKNNLAALKYLVDDKKKKEKKVVGRPKKVEEVEEIDNAELLEDIKRLKEGK